MAQTLNTIKTGMKDIGSKLDSLTSALNALTDGADAATAKGTISKSADVETAIKSASGSISKESAKLSLVDATSVSTAANELLTKTDAAITALISKKGVISKANQAGEAKTQLTAQKAAADGLVSAIVEKMPAAAQGIAKSQAAKVSASIAKGLAAYS